MRTPPQTVRYVLILLLGLFAGLSAACAQQEKQAVTQAARGGQPASYRIVINFRRNYHGKPRTEKMYTLLATVGETLPAIRDDARYRTDPACTAPTCYVEGATDVDILTLKPHGKLVTLGLKFSMQTIGNDAPDYLPKLPVNGTHQYLVTPTVALGQRVTVYTANDVNNNTTAEVQLLVEPFDPYHPGPQAVPQP